MKRRVNIGAALMNEPKLFILDEPTVGIDPQSRHHILETVKTLNQEKGMTVIYTSHYMEEVEYLCEKAAIMDHGSIIACGTKDELKQSAKASDTLTVNAEGLNDDAVKKSAAFPVLPRSLSASRPLRCSSLRQIAISLILRMISGKPVSPLRAFISRKPIWKAFSSGSPAKQSRDS